MNEQDCMIRHELYSQFTMLGGNPQLLAEHKLSTAELATFVFIEAKLYAKMIKDKLAKNGVTIIE